MAIEWVEVKAQRGDDVREMTNLQDAFGVLGKMAVLWGRTRLGDLFQTDLPCLAA